ncbi:hypothetical protein SLA2020_200680 [Shorea laevis]
MDVRVRSIGEKENKVHNYQSPAGDAFAHLETQFKFIVNGSGGRSLGQDLQAGLRQPCEERSSYANDGRGRQI